MDIASETEPTQRPISINVVLAPERHDCHHWIGLFRAGTMQPGDLLSCPNIQDAFTQLTENGLNEKQNILLTDTRQDPSRFYYLVPWHGDNQSLAQEQLEKTVALWNTDKIGIYIEPELFKNQKDAASFLRNSLSRLIEKASFKDYFLMIGNYTRANLINEALLVRETILESVQNRQIIVFH